MTKMILRTGLAGALVVAGSVSASAALLDFTDESAATGTYDVQGTASASGTLSDGNTWTLLPTPSTWELSYVTDGAPGGAPSTVPLAGDNDGVGVQKPGKVNDEITAPREMITLKFANAVRINALYFLDLFKATTPGDTEHALLSVDGAADIQYDAQEVYVAGGFGFGGFNTDLIGKSFKFSAGILNPNNNDDIGDPDFALAGVDVSPVPLPAGLLLLGGALAGLGVARRRKS